ncbi:cytoplasmic protein [Cryptococcus neoformans]|uniref:Cytoplasmic protein n=1 Tax=Cryptococcus neoformans (strain H99 / ATCC 208821 / CBS 10515 / FGSC 9487) TaxID=235443 RepID=J9VYC3_CRYN9|nr:cytoplasmic protein [Cryptococcus neoformans var. grubii H99]AUB28547.1 cytoplasmic protein [Cryptococcus neoformans var. grubii]OWT36051.1 cytoplasmic protein [Cryptococcus neoformans var. grubii Bt1]OWZ76866.1 cytoplasmic protein [Cryptococcus neoformans var. grubii Bt85]OXG12522.1 cytoplasmic protein [Cryptococcus neoformans var. grubii Ze90-1]OXG72431.1 cytoplasmic protein [Cryptococcus neoformans var. grubii MW-RSA36]OXL05481.1 cytoplasmic protein [Cryptococcus neoformans var. grubii |eukprot:XP_012053035.1 cytoplasmic protein [Cryptococcus neoformans var. grubii H99]
MPPSGPNTLPLPYAQVAAQPKREQRQPTRTSKLGSKLKVLPTQPETPTIPEEEEDDDGTGRALADHDESEGVEFYTPISQIPKGTARRDAQRLTKSEKAKLPRVTAYCTAATYNLQAMQAYLASRPAYHRTHPRMFDTECLHTPYLPPPTPGPPHGISAHRNSPRLKPVSGAGHVPEGDLLNLGNEYSSAAHKRASSPSRSNQNQNQSPNEVKRRPGFSKRPGSGRKKSSSESASKDTGADGMTDSEREEDDDLEDEWIPDVFLFEYGCVVLWGMTEKEEKKFLASIKRFEIERLSAEDVEMEDLNFYYADYSRIYNDVITLRKGSSYMTKLSLSHALSQSVKISLFEELIMGTIEQTKDIPKSLSETGKIGLPRSEIMKQIGNLFILRININLVGSILDSPEFFWTFPDLEPLYNAARSYLEIGQRVELLNARVDVLQDMLKLLKESVNSSHGERLEAIVIFLIGIEIVLGIITILVDLSFS